MNIHQKIRIGTRDSKLALIQAELVQDALRRNGCDTELVAMKTKGDKILDRTLTEIGGKGLFVAELEDALKAGEVDILVHSMKDVPMQLADGFPIVAASKRADARDVLVLPQGVHRVDKTGLFGTASGRRAALLRRMFPDCRTVPVRGNLNTRLRKLDAPTGEEPKLAGLILAAAGLTRLGLENRISRYFTTEELVPAAGQGILAIQAAENFDVSLLDGFADADALLCAGIEREFVRQMGGDCSSPIGAFCEVMDGKVRLTGFNGVYSIVETADRSDADSLAAQVAAKFAARGHAVLVGAGPGDPELLTLKGKRALQNCDAVLYDSLSAETLLAFAPEGAERVYVGKRMGKHSMPQQEISELLCRYVARGLRVVRLKGGDPFVFGRGGEELLALKEKGLSAEIIPGVTSAVAAPECGYIPVTHRGMARSFHVITGHQQSGGLSAEQASAYAALDGTLVFLMGLSSAGAIAEGLMAGGMAASTPAAIVQDGTLPQQKTLRTTLGELEETAKLAASPAIILVGAVCGLELCPPMQKRVVVTRESDKLTGMERALRQQGLSAYRYPCLKTAALPVPAEFSMRLREADLLVFSSDRGVDGFFAWAKKAGVDARQFAGKKFAVVGDRTHEALKQHGFIADILPVRPGGKYLAEEIAMLTPRDRNIWILSAKESSPALKEGLMTAGFGCILETAVYETVFSKPDRDALLAAVNRGEIGALSFTSGSSVEAFAASFGGEIPAAVTAFPAVCIGPSAVKACLKYGLKPVQAEKPSLESMAQSAQSLC